MIRFVVALPAEARPLVRRYALRPAPATPFRRWRGEGVELVVSGVGRAAAAAATGYLAGALGDAPAAWVNCGVAGHRDREVGTAVLADRVVDAATGRAWYPPWLFDPPCPAGTVVTVDRRETEFARPACYDMEAAGFVAAAGRLAAAELVQVVKVVSDTAAEPAERLGARQVAALVEARLAVVGEIAERTAGLARELAARAAPPAELAAFASRWRFTVTQRRRLERLLRRLAALDGRVPDPAGWRRREPPRAVLAALESLLQSHAPGATPAAGGGSS